MIISTLRVPAFPFARGLPTLSRVCEGHNQAFANFEGVPRYILYDNAKVAIKEIADDGKRERTEEFSKPQSHDLSFEAKFGRPGKGNHKEMVEGLVGYTLRIFMVPVQRAASSQELNAYLRVEQAFGCRHLNRDRLRMATPAWATRVREINLYGSFQFISRLRE